MSRQRKTNSEAMMPSEKNYASEDKSVQTQAACLNRIYRKVHFEGLSPDALQELDEDLKYISSLYHTDNMSAILLAAILEKSASNELMDDEDLATYLGCTNIEFIQYYDNLRQMEKAGLIHVYGNGRGRRGFRVTMEALKAVEKNCEFTPIKMSGLSADELFSRFRKYFKAFNNDAIDADLLLEEIDNLVKNNEHLLFCRKVLESPIYTNCTDTERRMFFYICHRYVSFGNKSVDIDQLTKFTEFFEDDAHVKRHIANEGTVMQRRGLVCFAIENGFVDSTSLSLSDQVKSEFFSEVELAPEETVRHRDIIGTETIQAKELFYNELEGAQVARLENLLDAENFKEVQKRLRSTGMRQGFNAIFYGAPGTGKTASVYELARRSGRDIFRVDMSKLKSKWVGDSEKAVRGVFKIYRSLCHSCEKVPIMLFNEADAIFTKRLEDVSDSVDQMSNALENIILEEMENIDGILIATTNLLSNLDPAFERRFIFKVEFKTPEKDSRAKIWRSMIPNLSEADANALADKYPFSGGNIENIARKSTVEYVLTGNEPTLSSMETYCEEEILDRRSARNRIGF